MHVWFSVYKHVNIIKLKTFHCSKCFVIYKFGNTRLETSTKNFVNLVNLIFFSFIVWVPCVCNKVINILKLKIYQLCLI